MQDQRLAVFAKVRWILVLFYVSGVVLYPLMAFVAGPKTPRVPAETAHLLGPIFMMVALLAYALSLFLEPRMLASARTSGNRPGGALSAGIIVAACGEVPATLGLVLAMMGIRTWPPLLYGLTLVHGIHLLTRWGNYQEVAEGK